MFTALASAVRAASSLARCVVPRLSRGSTFFGWTPLTAFSKENEVPSDEAKLTLTDLSAFGDSESDEYAQLSERVKADKKYIISGLAGTEWDPNA